MTESQLSKNSLFSELLFEANKIIVQDASSNEILEFLRLSLTQTLGVGGAALLDPGQEDQILFNSGIGEDVLELVFKKKSDFTTNVVFYSAQENKAAEEAIIIPLYYGKKILSLLILQKVPDEIKLSSSIDFLQITSSIVLTAIENKKWYLEFKHKTELNKELELASNVQQLLIPEKLPINDHFQASAYFKPQQHLSGDYYDFVQTSEKEFAFCMADVAGKGIPAALLMSNFQANWRTLLTLYPNLTNLVKELHVKVNHSSKGSKFITCFFGKYNLETRILNYVNAAHHAPVLYGGDNPLLLHVGCSGLGMTDSIPVIKQGFVTIPKDSFLLCYTDGLIESENDRGEQFGEERLIDLIKEIKNETTEQINQRLISVLKNFCGNDNFNDDVALLSLKFH